MRLTIEKRDRLMAGGLLLVMTIAVAALTGLWSVACFAAALFVMALTLHVSRLFRMAIASRNWPSVPASDVDARVWDNPKSRSYQLRVRYRYSVHGVEHEGTRTRYPFGVMLSVSTMRQRARELIAATALPVYYNPTDPSTCTLQTGTSTLDGLALIVFYSVAVPAIIALARLGIAIL